MSRKLFSKAMLPALLLSVVLWACDFQSDVASPLAPEAGASFSTSTTAYKVAKAAAESGSVSAVIGSTGGRLTLGKHELVVPKDAVSEATTFTLAKPDTSLLQFRLTATRTTTNDVGSSGFAVPVKLTVSYETATVDSESDLRIVWMKSDGTQEVRTTSLDTTGKRASANLGHFSDYSLAEP